MILNQWSLFTIIKNIVHKEKTFQGYKDKLKFLICV